MAGKLTNIAIKNAKPGPKPQRLFDGGGLYLEIFPAGGISPHALENIITSQAISISIRRSPQLQHGPAPLLTWRTGSRGIPKAINGEQQTGQRQNLQLVYSARQDHGTPCVWPKAGSLSGSNVGDSTLPSKRSPTKSRVARIRA
jgi:hypothetical protein